MSKSAVETNESIQTLTELVSVLGNFTSYHDFCGWDESVKVADTIKVSLEKIRDLIKTGY